MGSISASTSGSAIAIVAFFSARYLRANSEARAIAARYRQYELQMKAAQKDELQKILEDALSQRLAQGYEGLSARDIREQLAGTEMANVRNTFRLIKQVRESSDG